MNISASFTDRICRAEFATYETFRFIGYWALFQLGLHGCSSAWRYLFLPS